MSNKVWGLDFDSTINDLNGHICKTLKMHYDSPTTVDDITSWHFWDDHELGEVVWGKRMYHNENWTLGIPPKRNAVQMINKLIERGDRAIVISDRFETEYPVVRKWMDMNGLKSVPVILTNKVDSKVDIAERYGVTSVIDDSPHWIDMYTYTHTLSDIYVMEYEYNKEVARDSRIKRMSSWLDFAEMEIN